MKKRNNARIDFESDEIPEGAKYILYIHLTIRTQSTSVLHPGHSFVNYIAGYLFLDHQANFISWNAAPDSFNRIDILKTEIFINATAILDGIRGVRDRSRHHGGEPLYSLKEKIEKNVRNSVLYILPQIFQDDDFDAEHANEHIYVSFDGSDSDIGFA